MISDVSSWLMNRDTCFCKDCVSHCDLSATRQCGCSHSVTWGKLRVLQLCESKTKYLRAWLHYNAVYMSHSHLVPVFFVFICIKIFTINCIRKGTKWCIESDKVTKNQSIHTSFFFCLSFSDFGSYLQFLHIYKMNLELPQKMKEAMFF